MIVGYLPGDVPALDSHYDAFGNREALVAGDAKGIFRHEWRFDPFNRLKDAFLPGGADPTLAFTYNGRDDVTTLTRKNATPADYLETAFTWFDEGPVDTITVTDLLPTATQELLLDYGQVDSTLNVDTVQETRGGGSPEIYDYGYDGADRLTAVDYPGTFGLPADEDFDYDDAGNRNDPNNPGDYAYNANNRITKSPTSPVICHDADGNLTTKRSSGDCTSGPITETYSFDFTNRLRTRTNAAGDLTSFDYDPFGRRIRKVHDPAAGAATTTWFVWDGDQLLVEYEETSPTTSARKVRYVYAGGFAPIQVAYDDGASGEDLYDVHTDHLDTPRMLTDDTGAPAWRASYEAYGDAALDAGNAVTFNIRFPGQYFDAETGLHYNRFRYYDPDAGRYVNADPIGQLGGINVYRYTPSNPMNDFDQSGLNNFGGPVNSADLGLPPNSYKLYRDAVDKAAEEYGVRGNDQESRAKSDFQHCLASCEITKANGAAEAEFLGTANEALYGKGWGSEDNAIDQAANAFGRTLGSDECVDCQEECRAFADGSAKPPVERSISIEIPIGAGARP